jgi:hypothetical protein
MDLEALAAEPRGLKRYDAAFRENEIDETVLPSLTHARDPEGAWRHGSYRLKLLNAIAAPRREAYSSVPRLYVKSGAENARVKSGADR